MKVYDSQHCHEVVSGYSRPEAVTGNQNSWERNMVFLAVTPADLEDALRESDKSGAAVWCGADAIEQLNR